MYEIMHRKIISMKKKLEELFKEIKQGNKQSMQDLYEKYKSLVYGVAFSMLKNKEDSEDIVQIVFLKIFKLEKEKLPTKSGATWLYSVTKNETLNFLKNKKEEFNIDELYYITGDNKELNEIIEKDTYNKIITKLPSKEQEIVSLKILSKLSFKEISMILNIPIGTVQWRYYKGLHTLKLLLGNLSMFAITMVIIVLKKLVIPKRQSNQEEIKEEIINDSSEYRQEETLKKDETNIIENTEAPNDIIETTKTEVNVRADLVDIGILSISSIFLIATIIFFIIFIKHQQEARKKDSKK